MTATNGIIECGSTKALVISASEENREALSAALASIGVVSVLCSSMAEARKYIERQDLSIVLCDDCLPERGLEKVVAEVGKRRSPIPVIATSRTGEWDEFFEALRIGAFDYLSLPPRRDELERVLAAALGKNLRPSDGVKVGAAT